jgi:hypothetical protein
MLINLYSTVSHVIKKYRLIEFLAISTILFQLSTNFERNHVI